VNTHERPDVVVYFRTYVNQSLKDELQECCWIQLPKQLCEELLLPNEDSEKNLYTKDAHPYNDDNGNTIVEVHSDVFEADQLVILQNDDCDEYKRLGGCVSVRRIPGKIQTVFVQDKSTFKAYAKSDKTWTVDGIVPERHKGEGPGLMASAFVSREYGMGMQSTPDQLIKVNFKREAKNYRDEQSNGKEWKEK
jgi:hypothetical protein